MRNKPTVFISYSHKDEGWKDLLHPHLKTLVLEGVIDLWDDRKIGTGDEWYPEIQAAMERAQAAVCLISENYLSSDFIIKEEIPYLLNKRREAGMIFMPLLISPCPWKVVSWLKGIQMFPKDGRSIQGIKDAVEQKATFADIAVELFDKINPIEVAVEPATIIQAASLGIGAFGLSTEFEEVILPEEGPILIDIDRLPVTGAELFGRQKEMELLDKAWDEGKLNVVSFVAWGGVGKSTLINKWLESMKADNYRGAKRVFGWSFYSQGTSEKATSADLFINEALEWFGDPDPKEGSPWDKGQRLADLVRNEKTLLVLDGLEPLQAEHDIEKGKIKDPALSVLVSELTKENPGLLVITTREDIPDLNETVVAAIQKNLEQISPEAGRALLRTSGVRGTDKELEDASVAFGNQALALRLLGSYLYGEEGHQISRIAKIPVCENIPLSEGRHPRRVIVAFEERFGEGPEVEFLRILGLFDRPAEQGAIVALLRGKTISHLTKQIRKLGGEGLKDLMAKLRDLNLIAKSSRHDGGRIDSHPLLREHFGDQLKTIYPNTWREGNSRLYDYFRTQAPELPETIEEMMPLFYAIAHGCAAGRYQDAWDKVYGPRINRGNEYFSSRKLAGALSSTLSCLSHFFHEPWRKPVNELEENDRALLLDSAGFLLRGLGRLNEAVEPMQTSLELHITHIDWKNAALAACNQSEIFLAMGKVKSAVEYAKESLSYANKSEYAALVISKRASLADALHQAGIIDEAERLFRQAEELQKKWQPEFPFLYAHRGFLYSDLLLEKGAYEEVLERATQAMKLAVKRNELLNIGLINLSLGRAFLNKAGANCGKDYSEAEQYLNEAVEGLRKASFQEFVTRGLLARAELYRVKKEFPKAHHDLDETKTIATRGGIKLYEADCHLEFARLPLCQYS